jgi:signal peptidase II
MTESTHPAPELVGDLPPPQGPPPDEPGAGAASSVTAPPSFVFFGIVAGASLLVDVATKAWAHLELSKRLLSDPSIVLVDDHLFFTLAYNKGGAWGLLQTADEDIRKPFFLTVSLLAIAFIVSLYGKLSGTQRALKWGLPLVLGGALGNLSDRVVRSSVIDFIDYRADWILSMNELIAAVFPSWGVTDHWPTFNVADISICIGVGLMAVDMFTSRRGHARTEAASVASL